MCKTSSHKWKSHLLAITAGVSTSKLKNDNGLPPQQVKTKTITNVKVVWILGLN